MLQRSTRIKICGLQDGETIRQLDGLPIDEIGFVFAPSRRQVSPERAAELVQDVKGLRRPDGERPRTVGVLVNMNADQIGRLLSEAPLDVVQLHGDEAPEMCREIKELYGVSVWKVFSVTAQEARWDQAPVSDKLQPAFLPEGVGAVRLSAYAGAVDAVLIDTAGGGTGKTFAWHVIATYAGEAGRLGVPLYVAGGLHPDNITELLDSYAPDGVDVSSGVETDGRKDIEKIRRFVGRVKEV